ncbi:MAG: RibD family protein [Acidimicrobiia bacterium]
MSLDARIAAADGTSQWITGPEACRCPRLRADSQAIMVGAGTALADRPQLTVRDASPTPAMPPLRVVLDGRGRVPAEGPLFDSAEAPTLVVTSPSSPDAAQQAWLAAGAKVLTVPAGPGGAGVDLLATPRPRRPRRAAGARRGRCRTARGPALLGLADRVVTYVASTLLGTEGRTALDVAGPATIDATALDLTDVRLGLDVRMDYVPSAGAGA